MNEYEVRLTGKLKGGSAIIYAESFEKIGNTVFFYIEQSRGKKVEKQFKSSDVESVQKTWPTIGEIWENK